MGEMVAYNLGNFKLIPPLLPSSKMEEMARFGFRANPSLNRGGRGGVISLFIPSKTVACEQVLGLSGSQAPHPLLPPFPPPQKKIPTRARELARRLMVVPLPGGGGGYSV